MEAIDISIREHRTVTEYPATAAEYEALLDTLRVECSDDCEGEEHDGAGHSGPEARGWVRYWGTTEDGGEWQVDVVRPD